MFIFLLKLTSTSTPKASASLIRLESVILLSAFSVLDMALCFVFHFLAKSACDNLASFLSSMRSKTIFSSNFAFLYNSSKTGSAEICSLINCLIKLICVFSTPLYSSFLQYRLCQKLGNIKSLHFILYFFCFGAIRQHSQTIGTSTANDSRRYF